MSDDKAQDIARALKQLADSYTEHGMSRQAAALRESEWWHRRQEKKKRDLAFLLPILSFLAGAVTAATIVALMK